MFRHFMTSMRWRLLNPDPTGQWRVFDYFRYTMISNVFNLIMPGALGGDVVRSLYIMKEAESHRAANLIGILVDRVVGLFSILLLGTICGVFSPGLEQRNTFLLVMGGLLLAGVGGAGLSLYAPMNGALITLVEDKGKLGNKLASLLKTWVGVVAFYRANKRRLVLAFTLCFMIHGLWFVAVYILARNLEIDVGFLSLSMFTSISWLITAVPITFGGLGVREISFVVLLGSQGIPAEQATALSLAQFAIGLLVALFSLPFIWMGKRGSVAVADEQQVGNASEKRS
jgi:uncharacterized protein (TIRG00374 family)